MPAIGYEFYNSSGQLAFSGAERGFKYLGTATKTATVQPTSSTEGYSEFQITYAGNFLIPGLVISENSSYESSDSLISVTKSGNVWTIRCCLGGGSTTADGFLTESSGGTIRCWGNIDTASAVGIVNYDSSGNIINDILQNSFYIATAPNFNSNETSISFPTGGLRILSDVGFTRSIYPILLTACLGEGSETIATQASGSEFTQLDARLYRYRFYFTKTTTPGMVGGPVTRTLTRALTLANRTISYEDFSAGGIPFSTTLPAQTVMFADNYVSVVF